MLKSSLRWIVVSICVLVVVIGFGIYKSSQPAFGKKIFYQKSYKSFSINEIDFVKRDGYWHVANFNDYFANPDFIADFTYLIKNAEYGNVVLDDSATFYNIKIKNKTYQTSGALIQDNVIRQMSMSMKLSNNPIDYIAHPLMDIKSRSDIMSISVDGIKMRYISEDFLKEINSFAFEEVTKNIKEPKTKEVLMDLSNGIRIKITYYQNNWVSFDYGLMQISKVGAKEHSQGYQHITEGWYFKLVSAK